MICVTIILAFPICASSYDFQTYPSFSYCYNIRLLQNENQIFLLGSSANKVYIEAVYPSSYNIELTLENNVYSYNLFESTLIIVCPLKESYQTQIVVYDIDTDNLSSFVISYSDNLEFSKICYCKNYIYISHSDMSVKVYSKQGKLVNTCNLASNSYFLACDSYSNVYACSSDGVYKIIGNQATKIHFDNIFAPIKFVSDNVFINKLGDYYEINSNTLKKLSSYESSVYFPSGGLIDNHHIIVEGNVIFTIDNTNNSKDRYQKLQSPVYEICVIDSAIFALSYQNDIPMIFITKYSDMQKYNDSKTDTSTAKFNIESSVYKIDQNRKVITNIPHSTTVANFKKNINYNEYNLKFTRYDGKEIKSGNIGTGTIVTFSNGNYSIEYELSVIGDLTGEGNVNSRDRKMMFSCLLDEVSFSGVFYDSADIDNSGEINTTDLVLLLRLIEEQE